MCVCFVTFHRKWYTKNRDAETIQFQTRNKKGRKRSKNRKTYSIEKWEKKEQQHKHDQQQLIHIAHTKTKHNKKNYQVCELMYNTILFSQWSKHLE